MTRLCEDCGKPIPQARLAAIPDATLCVRCKALDDERPLRAQDLGETLASLGDLSPSEIKGLIQRGGD